jgi:hypothetical protein
MYDIEEDIKMTNDAVKKACEVLDRMSNPINKDVSISYYREIMSKVLIPGDGYGREEIRALFEKMRPEIENEIMHGEDFLMAFDKKEGAMYYAMLFKHKVYRIPTNRKIAN